MFLIFLIGIGVGIFFALYFLNLTKISKKNKNELNNEGIIIYLNFLLLNKREVVTDTVEAKLTSRFGNNSATRKLSKKLGKFAAGRIPDSAVTDKIGEGITSVLPIKLLEMGITGECKIVFNQGCYFIAKVIILKADVQTVIAKSAGKEKAGKFDMLMEIIGTEAVMESVENNILQVISGKLSNILPIKLKDQFASKGLEITIIAKTEEEQAKYMFNMLHNLDVNKSDNNTINKDKDNNKDINNNKDIIE